MKNTIEKNNYLHKYYRLNKDKRIAYTSQWQKENPGKANATSLKWYYQNLEQAKSARAKWRLDNPDYNKKYYQDNKQKIYELCKKWRAMNKDKVKLYRTATRLRRRAVGFITKDTIQRIYEDNIKQYGTLTCYLCGKKIKFGEDSIDHKQPISKGGNNDYCNLAIAHLICNKKKGAC